MPDLCAPPPGPRPEQAADYCDRYGLGWLLVMAVDMLRADQAAAEDPAAAPEDRAAAADRAADHLDVLRDRPASLLAAGRMTTRRRRRACRVWGPPAGGRRIRTEPEGDA